MPITSHLNHANIRSQILPIGLASGLTLFFIYAANAKADWHGDLSLRSEYVYRGYSKSRGNPVVQADLHYQAAAGWFVGAGLSQVSFNDHANSDYAVFEARPYLGWSQPLAADWRTELAVGAYVYNNKVFAQNADYAEFSAAVHFQDWLSGRVFQAPDAYQRHAVVPTYELNFRRDLTDSVQLSSGLGYSQAMALFEQDYFYWNVGFSWFVTRHLAVDVRYVDARLDKHAADQHQDEFYPSPLANNYLLSITLGF